MVSQAAQCMQGSVIIREPSWLSCECDDVESHTNAVSVTGQICMLLCSKEGTAGQQWPELAGASGCITHVLS